MGGAAQAAMDRECHFPRHRHPRMHTFMSELTLCLALLSIVFISGKI
jgi:hypothetical protein